MSDRKTIWEWSLSYVGDPASFAERGSLCLDFLREQGLKQSSRVLDVGCGNLSQGIPIMCWLHRGNYVGLDPNGWLIEAALLEYPYVEEQQPQWSYAGDFDATEYGPFDYVISHSVLSHVADWQLAQALLNIRAAVNEGAVWLASYRNDQFDIPGRAWVYPGVSFYRFDTIRVLGFHAGWHVEQLPDYQRRMIEVAPNDTHDWLKLTAVLSDVDRNALRLDEEERQRRDEEILALAQAEWERRRDAELAELAG